MIDFLEKVKEFHETFDMPVLNEPTIPDSERCDLRISLLEEEINELKQAFQPV